MQNQIYYNITSYNIHNVFLSVVNESGQEPLLVLLLLHCAVAHTRICLGEHTREHTISLIPVSLFRQYKNINVYYSNTPPYILFFIDYT